MILILGGTTEGRLAASVCEEAGKPFYYSTKSTLQQVELCHGVRLSGALTVPQMEAFCRQHNIQCLVDAAHPFAMNLHETVAQMTLPVIRLQRNLGKRIAGVTYVHNCEEAIDQLTHAGVKKLLALSGANTICPLRPYWSKHTTLFRILNRPESLALALQLHFPQENLLFYNEELQIPSEDEEKELMKAVDCDAILTKESGDNGGFLPKVQAALSLGLKVFVIEHPRLPQHWHYVTGKHSLRRAIESLVPSFFPLKTGLTTGACATAATKAALLSLLHDDWPEEVSFALPDEEVIRIPVIVESQGQASVIKEFSDDPDVTKGCRITAHVVSNDTGEIHFLKGKGVGTVTLPGLGIPVGDPAINATPRQMIIREIRALSPHGYDVEISVEDGEALAQKTFNPKVGVVGGISIIGTSGIVSPLSHEAFIQSIGRELEVALAIGCTHIGLAAGKNGEDGLKARYPDLRVIHYGNFIGEALKKAQTLGLQKVSVGIQIGKAVKLAEGHLDTHSHKAVMNKTFLRQVAEQAGADRKAQEALDNITLARELPSIMPPAFLEQITALCQKHCRTVFSDGELEILLL